MCVGGAQLLQLGLHMCLWGEVCSTVASPYPGPPHPPWCLQARPALKAFHAGSFEWDKERGGRDGEEGHFH